MKKLFVDDIRKAPDDSWHVVRTVTEAIRAIDRFEFDVISLDHDISHYENLDWDDCDQPVRECKETFAAVAYYIAAKYGFSTDSSHTPKVILHTANSVGGDEMAYILATAMIVAEKKYTI